MTKSAPYLPSSNAGELSPRLHARTDFVKYQNGRELVENMILLGEGGATRRAGTRYVAATKSASVRGRLKRFEFSTTQAYPLEFGANAIRFYRNQGQIVAADITGSIANGTFAANITSWTDKDTGGTAASSWNSAGYAQLLGDGTETAWLQQTLTSIANNGEYTLKFRIIGAPGDKVYLRIGTSDGGTEIVNDRAFETGYHVYTFTATATTIYLGFRNTVARAMGFDDVSFIDGTAVELQTPYGESDLPDLAGPQSADVLYLFHPDYPTYKLARYAHNSWSLIEVAWQDGPWLEINATATTLTAGAATGENVTLTASATTGINDGQGWLTTDIGRLVRFSPATTNYGWGVIVSRTSSTVVNISIKRTLTTASATTKWRLGAWSGTTGYPRCGGFYEQRLFSAATSEQPQTLWGSQTGDFENHSPDSANPSGGAWDGTVEDDDAVDYTLSGDTVQEIRWLSPGSDTLVIGTASGEWTPTSEGAVITPTDFAVRQQTTHGSAAVQPLRVDHAVLFVQKAKRKLRELAYSFEVDGYRASDMTRLAEHVTVGGIREMDFAEEPNSVVYAVREDGQVPAMTYRRDEDVVGFGRQILGGSFQGGDAVVESLVVVPGNDGDGQVQDSTSRDEVWMIVKRTINGATARYVEFIEKDWETGDAQEDAYYVDSMLTLDNPVTISGATAADPVVVTATAHGFTDGDEVRITDVVGMTELNTNSYLVTEQQTNDFELSEIEVTAAVSAATAANPVVITTDAAHGLVNGDKVAVFDVVGMTELNGQRFTVANKTSTTFELSGVNGSAYTAYISGGTVHHVVDGTDFEAYISGGVANEKVLTVTGLDHLEGETVAIWGDGAVLPTQTVASGSITLDSAASVVQVGLPYKHKIRTLKQEGGSPLGTSVGKLKSIDAVTFVVLNSHSINFGPDEDNLQELDFREVGSAMDEAVPLFTGEKRVEFNAPFAADATDPRIYMESDAPAPFTLLAIAPEIDVKPIS